ncbi:hypothetical protein OF83DRAFT_1159848 [Amylostereum chailletii]|nr:hypothetical protein OF83DRAFT_1159848 [Amylostereum chailletii]
MNQTPPDSRSGLRGSIHTFFIPRSSQTLTLAALRLSGTLQQYYLSPRETWRFRRASSFPLDPNYMSFIACPRFMSL